MKVKEIVKMLEINSEAIDEESQKDQSQEEEDVEILKENYQRGEIKDEQNAIRSSFFALAIRNDWEGVAYLLLQSGYDIMQAAKVNPYPLYLFNIHIGCT